MLKRCCLLYETNTNGKPRKDAVYCSRLYREAKFKWNTSLNFAIVRLINFVFKYRSLCLLNAYGRKDRTKQKTVSANRNWLI